MDDKNVASKVNSEQFKNDILKHKKMAELQYVTSLYSDRDLFDEYKLDPKLITNPHWRMYYLILEQVITKKKMQTIDEINMDMFVSEQKDALKKVYDGAGGFATIKEAMSIIETDNIESYYMEVLRYSAITKLIGVGFNVEKNWDKIRQLSYQELNDYITGTVDTIFSSIDMGEDKEQEILSGIKGMIKRAHEGVRRGLPLASKLLNSVVNGQVLGNITMVGGSSGVGKTFLTLNQILPSVIQEKEPILIMCNEEEVDKWQSEMLTWVINNHLKNGDFVKSRFYQGDFSTEEMDHLTLAEEWLSSRIEDGLIRFVNFNMYSMDKAIRLIRKYAKQRDTKYFIIDTLKLDNDIGSSVSDNSWLQLQQNMVKLYNTIKPSSLNVHVWVTYQLSKTNKTRFLDQSSLGISKNVADVVSTLILVRNVLESEKGSNGLVIKNGGQTVNLDEGREYMVAFIDKNRQGSTHNQIVWDVDKGRNIIKDEGFTKISQDF